MCGLAGFIDRSSRAGTYDLAAVAGAMGTLIAHRGPDDDGVWVDPACGLALSHRRLSIIDLSAAGHQPMVSACGRYVIVYNGEVYSHEGVRPRLLERGVRFAGHSDTEVILESCAAFGVERTLEWMIGMFVFALWDREERTLVIARDRLGIKPLFWGQFGGLFVFASEIKALRAHPGFEPEIDRNAVAAYMRHNYIPAPNSIYRGLQKLEPGCFLVFRGAGAPKISRYWTARSVVSIAVRDRAAISDAEATEQLQTLLSDAVSRRMIADVPLGAFLSGGVDSSTVVALMQANSNRPVRTYAIGFAEKRMNEAGYAKAVAEHLHTDHTELYVTARDALAVIPRLPDWYDEPFADSSQIPTFLISEMTRQHVKVALSGDGGDELFAGYNRYAFAAGTWSALRRLPVALREVGARMMRGLSPMAWDHLLALLPRGLVPNQAGDKIYKMSDVLALDDADDFYRTLVSLWRKPEDIVAGASEARGILWDETVKHTVPNFVDRMQFLDIVTYLPDDILAKVDRASMAVGLEVRVPLLDHRLVDFAFRLPSRFKRRDGVDKWILREVLYRYVPRHLIERPKMGFAVPLDRWLRHDLRDWAEELLAPQRLVADGFNPEPIRRAWQEHLSGSRNWQYLLWAVLMFQAWRERWH